MGLELQPISFGDACAFIAAHHRHNQPPVGWKFGMAVNDGVGVVGVCVVSRPVARHCDDGWTLEVVRCCTDGTSNACSMLYGAAWRAAKALGYRRLITYTLKSEGGATMRATGWRCVGERKGERSWSAPSRPREALAVTGDKLLWEAQ